MPRGVGTRMTGHPDIEPISKVTTGEGSEALLLATPPASWAGGGGLFWVAGPTRSPFQLSLSPEERVTAHTWSSLAFSWVMFLSSKNYKNHL